MEDSLYITPTWVPWQPWSPPPPDHRVILRQPVQLPISKRYCSLSVRMSSARELRPELDGLSILRADFQSRQSRRRRAHASAARRRVRRDHVDAANSDPLAHAG